MGIKMTRKPEPQRHSFAITYQNGDVLTLEWVSRSTPTQTELDSLKNLADTAYRLGFRHGQESKTS